MQSMLARRHRLCGAHSVLLSLDTDWFMLVPCRSLQPNHFGVLALPVGEFLGLLHGAVFVGTHAVDGDLSRLSSAVSNGGASDSGSAHGGKPKAKARSEPEPASTSQFFAQSRGDSTPPVPLVKLSETATLQEVRASASAWHMFVPACQACISRQCNASIQTSLVGKF